MDKLFKINAYFDKSGENIEKIIARYLINNLNNSIINNKSINNSKKQELNSSIWIYKKQFIDRCKFKIIFIKHWKEE